jgi:anaerobic selenocysteine-containing dehydrogenase
MTPTARHDLAAPRHDWTLDEVEALFARPFMELVYEAATVHRAWFDPSEVQKSQLLSIKTGGCAENCGYCSQSASFDTGLKAEKLMDATAVMAEAMAAKGFTPKRTVIFVSGQDEEAGGSGARAANDLLKARGVKALFVLDEGMAVVKDFPIILSSGRLMEYEGGGEETRSNKWLAELQQDMFVEINPADATARGIVDGGWVWVSGPENQSKARVKALVTERVGKGVAFMPFHFGGWFQGVDQRGNYPKGTDPIVLGESVNTVTTYGYDPVTGMHEGKVTLCQIKAA